MLLGSIDDPAVAGRLFDEQGTPRSAELVLSQTAGSEASRISSDPDGGFVVVHADGGTTVAWSSYGSPGSDLSGASVHARRFAADGAALGGQFQINTQTLGGQEAPRLAAAEDALLAVWHSASSSGSDSSDSSIEVRRFAVAFFCDGFDSGDLGRWSSSVPE